MEWSSRRPWHNSWTSTYLAIDFGRKSRFRFRLMDFSAEQLPHLVLCRRTAARLKGSDSSALSRSSHGTNTSFARLWSHWFSEAATVTGSSTGPVSKSTFPACSDRLRRWAGVREYSARQVSPNNPRQMDFGLVSSSGGWVRSRFFLIQPAFFRRISGISDRSKPMGTTTSSSDQGDTLMITCRARLLSRTS